MKGRLKGMKTANKEGMKGRIQRIIETEMREKKIQEKAGKNINKKKIYSYLVT